MQDGAPSHSTKGVRHFYNDELPGRGLGTENLSNLPVWSCDITTCDFFFEGGIKYKSINDPPQPLRKLEHVIRDVLTNVPAEFLRKAVHGGGT